MLQELGLNGYILDGPDDSKNDTSFLNTNRLGIFSSVGHMSIYLISVAIGRFVLQQRLVSMRSICPKWRWFYDLSLVDVVLLMWFGLKGYVVIIKHCTKSMST
jgi:hypothetical protein